MLKGEMMATDDHGVMHKNWLTAFFLSLLLGWLGADRFYLGKPGTALLKILTFSGFGIWYVIDLIMIATKNVHGIAWENTGKEAVKKAWIGFAVVVVLGMFIGGGTTASNNAQKAANKEATAVNSDASATAQPVGTLEDKQETATPPNPAPAATPAPAPSPKPAAPAPAAPSVSQKNALNKAKQYLAYTAFSHDGLIDQLVYEKFSEADAAYGADNVGADWNTQAAKKAKSYMSFSSFSRGSLIDQLKYDKFTQSQAEYGASSVGL